VNGARGRRRCILPDSVEPPGIGTHQTRDSGVRFGEMAFASSISRPAVASKVASAISLAPGSRRIRPDPVLVHSPWGLVRYRRVVDLRPVTAPGVELDQWWWYCRARHPAGVITPLIAVAQICRVDAPSSTRRPNVPDLDMISCSSVEVRDSSVKCMSGDSTRQTVTSCRPEPLLRSAAP